MTNRTSIKTNIFDAAFTFLLIATGGFAFPIVIIIFALNLWIGYDAITFFANGNFSIGYALLLAVSAFLIVIIPVTMVRFALASFPRRD